MFVFFIISSDKIQCEQVKKKEVWLKDAGIREIA